MYSHFENSKKLYNQYLLVVELFNVIPKVFRGILDTGAWVKRERV